ncbi:MAG: hypothetical protein R2713_20360 [Ilumatobacteraceae bacterium]
MQISAEGLMVGAGYYAMASDQLERFRRAVDLDATGGRSNASSPPSPQAATGSGRSAS